MVQVVHAASRKKGSYLSALYGRLTAYFTQRRKGAKADYLLRQLEKLGVSIQIELGQIQMSPG